MGPVTAALLAALALACLVLLLVPGPSGWTRRSLRVNVVGSGMRSRQRPGTAAADTMAAPGTAGEAGHGLSRRRRAPRPLLADAAAALLDAGAGLEAVLMALGDPEGPAPELGEVGRRLAWGADWEHAWQAAPRYAGMRDALALAAGTGAPVGVLLRQAAQDERRALARREDEEAAALTVRLVLPLGLCGLPAFICLGIVPLAIALVPWG